MVKIFWNFERAGGRFDDLLEFSEGSYVAWIRINTLLDTHDVVCALSRLENGS